MKIKWMLFTLLIFSIFSIFSITAVAESGIRKGKIKYVRVHEPKLVDWAPPVFWFSLEGLSSFGSCKQWNGNILLVAEHEFFFSMILTTQAVGGELAVGIDDAKVGAAGHCRAVYITTGNPPTLN